MPASPNSASIFPEDTVESADSESLARNHEINAVAPLDLSRFLAAQKSPGAIVNFLDTRIWDNDAKHFSYHLSKRTLFSMTRLLADEFAPLVRVNGVALDWARRFSAGTYPDAFSVEVI